WISRSASQSPLYTSSIVRSRLPIDRLRLSSRCREPGCVPRVVTPLELRRVERARRLGGRHEGRWMERDFRPERAVDRVFGHPAVCRQLDVAVAEAVAHRHSRLDSRIVWVCRIRGPERLVAALAVVVRVHVLLGVDYRTLTNDACGVLAARVALAATPRRFAGSVALHDVPDVEPRSAAARAMGQE